MPTTWLCSVLKLLDVMAGEGIVMEDCEDPADLLLKIARHMGCDCSEDPYEATLNKLVPVIWGTNNGR